MCVIKGSSMATLVNVGGKVVSKGMRGPKYAEVCKKADIVWSERVVSKSQTFPVWFASTWILFGFYNKVLLMFFLLQ